VVVILSEWWLVPTTADHCGHIPAEETVGDLKRAKALAKISLHNKMVLTLLQKLVENLVQNKRWRRMKISL